MGNPGMFLALLTPWGLTGLTAGKRFGGLGLRFHFHFCTIFTQVFPRKTLFQIRVKIGGGNQNQTWGFTLISHKREKRIGAQRPECFTHRIFFEFPGLELLPPFFSLCLGDRFHFGPGEFPRVWVISIFPGAEASQEFPRG